MRTEKGLINIERERKTTTEKCREQSGKSKNETEARRDIEREDNGERDKWGQRKARVRQRDKGKRERKRDR